MDFDAKALVVVDMQNYYLSQKSSYYRYFSMIREGCLDYIITRCSRTVIPNISKIMDSFRENNLPVVFLRLCGKKPDRSDLHPFFRRSHLRALGEGYPDLYPLDEDPMSDVVDALSPAHGDIVIRKTTFSPFTLTDIDTRLRKEGIKTLVFTGLATSQCVETTARDASERDYIVVHVEDAQADYDEMTHHSSLFSSQGVCGGNIYTTTEFLDLENGNYFR